MPLNRFTATAVHPTPRGRLWLLAGLALAALMACKSVSSAALAPTATLAPTETPTLTPEPSVTPSLTPEPSPTPTDTPLPTDTPVPPTTTPQPFIINDKTFQGDFDCTVDITINKIEGDSFSITFNAGSAIPIHNGRMSIWCWGAKQTWAGKLSYKGYTFDSDAVNPLQFVIEKRGYVYVKGTGTVTLPDGKQVTLPQGGGGAAGSGLDSPTATGVSSSTQPAKAQVSPLPPMTTPACTDFHRYDFSVDTLVNAREETWAKWGYESGELFVAMKEADSWFFTNHRTAVSNAMIEVDVRQTQDGPGKFGLIFGSLTEAFEDAYIFGINGRGNLGLSHRIPDADDEEINSFEESSFVLPGSATNHLAVMIGKQAVGITVNGFTSGSAAYLPKFPAESYAGLTTWSFEQAGLEARFKNFTICTLADTIPLPVYPLGKVRRYWPANHPLYLETVWAAKTADQAAAFAKLADTKLVIDGTTFNGLKEYWGTPAPIASGFGVAWRLPLPALPVGIHRIELIRTIPEDIDDGFSITKAGEVSNGWIELEVK